MKRIMYSALILVLTTITVIGQIPDRKGYVGVSLGPAFILSKKYPHAEPGAGLNLGLINFSYRIKDRVGICLDWTGGAFSFNSQLYTDRSGSWEFVPLKCAINYGAITLGPMYSLKTSEHSSLDIKAKFGRFYSG